LEKQPVDIILLMNYRKYSAITEPGQARAKPTGKKIDRCSTHKGDHRIN